MGSLPGSRGKAKEGFLELYQPRMGLPERGKAVIEERGQSSLCRILCQKLGLRSSEGVTTGQQELDRR